MDWPPHAPSIPELDRLRAQLSALMTYRTAAEVPGQMFPVDAGTVHETLRRHATVWHGPSILTQQAQP